jgi:hypothetical protein
VAVGFDFGERRTDRERILFDAPGQHRPRAQAGTRLRVQAVRGGIKLSWDATIGSHCQQRSNTALARGPTARF